MAKSRGINQNGTNTPQSKIPPASKAKMGRMAGKTLAGPAYGVSHSILNHGGSYRIRYGIEAICSLPLFRGLIIPQIIFVVEAVLPTGIFQNILIGEYGFLVKGLEPIMPVHPLASLEVLTVSIL